MTYDATGRLNLLESTLVGNSATDGGALLLDGATAFLRQVTLVDNSAAGGGGIALESSAGATILQSTIVENQASANGGGLKISSSNVLLQNSLIADNSATTAYPDVDGAVLAASSYNLISDGTGMSGISDGSQGNQVGTSGTPIDALLGTLGDHGGPVQTVSLRVDSPALDAGSDALAITRLGRPSSVVYDALGRVVGQVATDPDGISSEEAPATAYTFDANGNLLNETDPLGSVTAYTYDNLGRKTSETDAEDGETSYTYLCPCQLAIADFSADSSCPGTEKRVGGAGGGDSSPCSPAGGGRNRARQQADGAHPWQDARAAGLEARAWRFRTVNVITLAG